MYGYVPAGIPIGEDIESIPKRRVMFVPNALTV
jgi:hypothetical protein